MIANYHTHTYRCKHAGKFSDSEYVESAITNGFKVIGFSDHTPWNYTSGYVSRIRMSPDELPEYCKSINDFKEQYEGQIEILLGLECEYFPAYMDWLEKLHSLTDYLIFGCHWSPSDEHGELYFSKVTDTDHLRNYFRCAVEGMKTGLYKYIAHPDLVFSNYPQFDSICEEGSHALCETAREMGLPLEFNISGYEKKNKGEQNGLGFPNEDFWRIAKEAGCTAVLGLDAHNPSAFGKHDDIKRAEDTLKKLGITIIDTLF